MYKSISLFSGAMGMDLGLERSGFEPVLCVEQDKDCVATIRFNKPHLPVLGDITGASSKDILKYAKLKVGEVDLVVGGPPCQSFSTAGRRLSVQDPRGNLIYEFIRVVSETKPRFFVMENVKGLLSAAVEHMPLKDRETALLTESQQLGSVFSKLMEDFAGVGYKLIWSVMDAVNYGVPQFRERLIIIGSRDYEDIFIPRQTHFMLHQNPSYRWVTLGDAIIDLEDNPGPCARFSPERAKLLEMVPQGKNWRALPKGTAAKALGGAYEASGGKMGFFRRLSYHEPCPTLVTSPVQKATMLCHPNRTRPLSTEEYKRVQGFPDTWFIHGTVAQVYKQVGNAVPVGLGDAIGQMLKAVATGRYVVQTKRVRGTSVHKPAGEKVACQI